MVEGSCVPSSSKERKERRSEIPVEAEIEDELRLELGDEDGGEFDIAASSAHLPEGARVRALHK